MSSEGRNRHLFCVGVTGEWVVSPLIGQYTIGFPMGLQAVSLDDIAPHAPEVEETGYTFAANAALKAINAYEATGELPSLADDSGICVEALNGAPGIRSARFAGVDASDPDNNRKLLHDLRDETDRRAHFYCALALVCHREQLSDPNLGTSQWPGLPASAVLIHLNGRVDGIIAHEEAKGTGGFGYDPLFFVPELNCTFSEVPAEQKHALSHRGQAFRELLALLQANSLIAQATKGPAPS